MPSASTVILDGITNTQHQEGAHQTRKIGKKKEYNTNMRSNLSILKNGAKVCDTTGIAQNHPYLPTAGGIYQLKIAGKYRPKNALWVFNFIYPRVIKVFDLLRVRTLRPRYLPQGIYRPIGVIRVRTKCSYLPQRKRGVRIALITAHVLSICIF